MRHSPDPMFCEFDGCTREPLPHGRYCQFCQRKGVQRDYLQQASAHRAALEARRKGGSSPEPWEMLLVYCAPSPGKWGGTHTYALGVHRYVKFGQSRDLKGRIRNLQAANPHRLRLLGQIWSSTELEHHIQSALRPHTHRGEWFDLNESAEAFIRLMNANDMTGICQRITSLVEAPIPAMYEQGAVLV